MKKFFISAIAVLGAIIAFLLARIFWFTKKGPDTIAAQPTTKEQEAEIRQTEALIERAKVEAVSEERRQNLEKIQKISDPQERRRRLAEELKNL